MNGLGEEKSIMNTVNMVLATFGECTVDFAGQKNKPKQIVVNWIFFPEVNIFEAL